MTRSSAARRQVQRFTTAARALTDAEVRLRIREQLGPVRPQPPWLFGPLPEVPDREGGVVAPPDFIGVGAQKAGTTWWFALLGQHPRIHPLAGGQKELHLLNRCWSASEAAAITPARYASYFPRPAGFLCGEFTPDYLHRAWAPPAIARCAPEARLVVLLREPRARITSALRQYGTARGMLTPMVVADAVARSTYGAQLERLWRHVPREQTLVLVFEACRLDPVGELHRTFDFLTLERINPVGTDVPVNVNVGEPPHLDDVTWAWIDDVLAEDRLVLDRVAPELPYDLWER